MQTKSYSTVVVLPDNSNLEVIYYCMDTKLNETEKKNLTQLFIQLHDCICTLQIEKSICKNLSALENLVHNKVINTKGHLC
jgi:hypothetical protein